MPYDPDLHHRRSIRLPGYDYAQEGAYFVTVCVQGRDCLLGEIRDGQIHLNGFGEIIEDEWLRTADLRPQVALDVYAVMPNHMHAILIIQEPAEGRDKSVGAYCNTPLPKTSPASAGKLHSPSQTVGAMIRGFKSAATRRINELRETPGVPVWQRGYYEHVIRDEDDLNRIRQYMVNNPARWAEDEENPTHPRN